MSAALAAMYRIARELDLRTEHRDATNKEAVRLAADDGTDDPSLVDLTELPFVTIDYERSWDLDQALFIRELKGGYEVFYALADAAHFVRAGHEVFQEAMQRGTSYYLPGLTLPMLPAVLSEGTTSLLPEQRRRAITFRIELDDNGVVQHSEILRSVIRSRAKLTYGGVQLFLDSPSESPISEQSYRRSLELMAVVSTLRLQVAESRDVVRYDRVGVGLSLSADGKRVVVTAETRNAVQLHNEQISLLCNMEGAKLLTCEQATEEALPGLFRIHEAPTDERLDALVAFIDSMISEHAVVADRWTWRRDSGESLADYVARLPADPASRRLAQAIQRQAMVAARPSYFATEPGPHYGIGASAYSRFSAPMRELIGILTHHLALARLDGASLQDIGLSMATLEEAVSVANRAKGLQRQATKLARAVALGQLFSEDVKRPASRRRRWLATVMGITPSKVYMQLDDPPVDVKLYLADLESAGHEVTVSDNGCVCVVGPQRLVVGAALEVVVSGRVGDRWLLVPV